MLVETSTTVAIVTYTYKSDRGAQYQGAAAFDTWENAQVYADNLRSVPSSYKNVSVFTRPVLTITKATQPA